MVSLTQMYRRPKSLEVLLAIREEMSEIAEHDVATFVEMIRTGDMPVQRAKTVTRVQGEFCDEDQTAHINQTTRVEIADE